MLRSDISPSFARWSGGSLARRRALASDHSLTAGDRRDAQARAGPGRARAAGPVAAAAAAAVARRAALQRVGDRGRRWDRPRRHGDARAGIDGAPRACAADVQPAPGERAPARMHARAFRSLRTGGDDRRADRMRAVDASQPRAHERRRRGSRGGVRAADRDRPPSGVPEEPLARYARERKNRSFGIAAHRARPPAPSGGRHRHRPRPLDRVRDPGARAVARVPVRARPAPAHLRRSPARARLDLLRLRLLARSGRGVPRLAAPRRGVDARLCLPGHGRTFTDVQAHIVANRELVARAPAARARRGVERAADGVRGPPARLRRRAQRDDRQLVAVRDALLSSRHLEAEGRVRRLPARPTAGSPRSRSPSANLDTIVSRR